MAANTRIDTVALAVGVAIQKRRTELGLRPEDVAARSGLSMSTIVRLERGAGATVSTLKRIADALDTTVAKLIDGEAA